MPAEEKIDIDLFKTVFKAMAQSDNLEIMANHLTQLLVAALEIKSGNRGAGSTGKFWFEHELCA